MSETYTIPDGTRRSRADKLLAAALPAHSRTAWQRAFDAGLVRRAGAPILQKATLLAGETVEYDFPAVIVSELVAAKIKLAVLFEDKHMLAIDKPAGMVVHPGAGTGGDTLVHALLAHCAGGLSGIGGVERPGIVHRLDKDTSGVIVVAKTDAAHRALAAQFEARTLRKEYLALVAGVPGLLSGAIVLPIGRHPKQRHKMTTGEGGRPARTEWKREETFGKVAALLRCRIFTGRTHQIRVHLKSLGHPILGDLTYGWKQSANLAVQPPRCDTCCTALRCAGLPALQAQLLTAAAKS